MNMFFKQMNIVIISHNYICTGAIRYSIKQTMMQATLAAVCCLTVIFIVASEFTPVVYETTSNSQCGQQNEFENDQQLMKALKKIQQQLPPPGCNHDPPSPSSCKDVIRCNSSASSGYYHIQAANGSAVQVYCDMEGANCGGEGGWMRVAHFNMTYDNMTDPQCPAGFELRVKTANEKRFCTRNTGNNDGCQLIIKAESFGLTYSHVCGYVRGYAFGSPDGFVRHLPAGSDVSLSGNYVDGVSITYGTSNISHIWTYVAGLSEVDITPFNCPCNIDGTNIIPEFVGNDYYCEASNLQNTADPLWDGMQCGGLEGPCCNHTGLPWFHKDILTPTTATITMHVCLDEGTWNENIGVERFELYVQ